MPSLSPVTFNGFNLNDGINYFVIKKQPGFAKLQPSIFKIGRLEGMKKTGENINERTIGLDVRVIGVSRTDLENKIDAMLQALYVRNAALAMHTNDLRYFVCDLIDAKYELKQGDVISTVVSLQFVAFLPYAFSSTSSIFDTTTTRFTTTSGVTLGLTNYSQSYTIAGGGNVFSRPNIRMYYRTPACTGTFTGTTMTKGPIYTSLTVSPTPAQLYAGDDIVLTQGTNTQTIVVAADTPAGSTVIPTGGYSAIYTFGHNIATYRRIATWTSVQITQVTDTMTFTMTGSLPSTLGDYVDINCDPTQGNGYSAIINSGVGNIPRPTFQGVFPVQEPYDTTWNVTIVSNSTPLVQLQWTWVPRWLS